MPGQDQKIGERNLARPFRFSFRLFNHRFNFGIACFAILFSIAALLTGSLLKTVPRPAQGLEADRPLAGTDSRARGSEGATPARTLNSAASVSPRFPNLIENGDFESYYPPAKPYIWRLEPEAFFLWDLFSRPGGKRSLFIGASMIAPLDYARLTCRLRLPAKPQAAYLFEGSFIRNRNIDGVYPTVSLFGQERRLSDFWASGNWQKISVIFQSSAKLKSAPAPSEFLRIEAPRDDYFLWVDDLSLREIMAAPVSPPNGARINRESIEFTWEMTPTDRLLDIVLVLSRDKEFRGRDGREFRINNAGEMIDQDQVPNGDPAQSFAADSDVLTLFVPNSLDKGKWFWRLEIYQYKTPLAMSETRHFFVEKEYPENSSASSRTSGRGGLTLSAAISHFSELQNLDFFPIGMYGVPSEDFKELSEIGFNAASYFSSAPDSLLPALSAARANSLKVLVSPSAVLQPLHSDSILGWYLEDEPEGRSISPKILFNRRAALLRQEFQQPGVIVLNRSWRAVDYAPAADIIMTDPYPIPFEPLSWLSANLDEIHAAVGSDPAKRVWAVIQAFGWNYGSDAVRETGLGRDPTGDEVRTLTYLALAHKAQGLFYYVYKSGNYFIKERGNLWEGLKKTVGEVRQLLPVIQAPEARLDFKTDSDKTDASGIPAVHAIIKELRPETVPDGGTVPLFQLNSGSDLQRRPDPFFYSIGEMAAAKRPGNDADGIFIAGSETTGHSPLLQPGYYLISVNVLNEPVTATFDFKRPPSAAAFDFFSGAGFPLSDSRLVLEFKPLERKILYFNPAL
jgi:hypothetical protein